jgi:TRAP-type uncharacterized transport system fused permease subunit
MLIGPWQEVALAIATASVGVICLAAGLHSFFLRPTRWWERAMLLGAAIVLITPGLITDLIGGGLLALTIASQLLISRADDLEPMMPPDPAIALLVEPSLPGSVSRIS